jgi:hypothetical protein
MKHFSSFWFLATGYWLLASGSWSLAHLLAAGFWQLATGKTDSCDIQKKPVTRSQ